MTKNKPPKVKIIQISAVASPKFTLSDRMYGLGDDGLVYKWEYKTGKWNKYWEVSDE